LSLFFDTADALDFAYRASTSAIVPPGISRSGRIFNNLDVDDCCGDFPVDAANCFFLITIALFNASTRSVLFFVTAEDLRLAYSASTSARVFPGNSCSGEGETLPDIAGFLPEDAANSFFLTTIARSNA
jgi:hypothetical protein